MGHRARVAWCAMAARWQQAQQNIREKLHL
jgi:hypothetical protein